MAMRFFKNADSIAIEIDMDQDVTKKTFAYAEKYNKKVYALVSNMSIAIERRDFIRKTGCFVCNQQEAGILFSEDYENITPEELCAILPDRIRSAKIPQMVVTMGKAGAVYATLEGDAGVYPALKVDVVDTTGAGDAFFLRGLHRSDLWEKHCVRHVVSERDWHPLLSVLPRISARVLCRKNLELQKKIRGNQSNGKYHYRDCRRFWFR